MLTLRDTSAKVNPSNPILPRTLRSALLRRTRRLRPAPYTLGHQRSMLMVANDARTRLSAAVLASFLATDSQQADHVGPPLRFLCQLFSRRGAKVARPAPTAR